MSGVKRNKANAYWSFRQEKIRSSELQGLSIAEQDKIIGKIWAELKPETKEDYKKIAAAWNANQNNNNSSSSSGDCRRSSSFRPDSPGHVYYTKPVDESKPKSSKKAKIGDLKDSRGESIEEREKKVKERREYRKRMDERVTEFIDAAVDNEVFNRTNFHLVSTQHFYETEGYDEEHEFFPAEIAIGKFSLLEGVHERFHSKINPGPLPVGAAYDAGRKSEREHKYPTPSENDEDKTNFVDLVHDILTFLLPEKELPIFFVRDRDVFHVKKILDTIFTRCGESQETLDAIHVYPAERLLYRLSKKMTEIANIGIDPSSEEFKMPPMPSDPYALEEYRSKFEAYEACEYHEEVDKIVNCSLAKVNGTGYLLAQFLCDKRHYEMIEGQHKPKRLKTVHVPEDEWY